MVLTFMVAAHVAMMLQEVDSVGAAAALSSGSSALLGAVLGAVGAVLAALIGGWALLRSQQRSTEAASRRQREELGRLEDVVRELVGLPTGTPMAFVDELKNAREYVIYRKHSRARFDFEDRGEGHMTCTVTASYTLVNVNTKPEEYSFRIRIAPTRPDEDNRLLHVEAKGKDLDKQIEQPFPETGPEEHEFHRILTVQPNSGSPENELLFRYRKDCLPSDTDVMLFFFPTQDVVVELGEAPADLEFTVNFSHRLYDAVERGPGTWRLNAGFLPWQSVVAKWDRGHDPSETEAGVERVTEGRTGDGGSEPENRDPQVHGT